MANDNPYKHQINTLKKAYKHIQSAKQCFNEMGAVYHMYENTSQAECMMYMVQLCDEVIGLCEDFQDLM